MNFGWPSERFWQSDLAGRELTAHLKEWERKVQLDNARAGIAPPDKDTTKPGNDWVTRFKAQADARGYTNP